MSDEKTTPRAETLKYQNVGNAIVRTLLATPVVSKGIGRKLITLYVVGRKSGRRYSIPIAYERHEGTLLIGTPFPWVRNVRDGDSLDVRYLGQRRTAKVRVYTEEPDVAKYLAVLARNNTQFADFNKIGRDDAGEPDANDLHLAWLGGARVLRLTI